MIHRFKTNAAAVAAGIVLTALTFVLAMFPGENAAARIAAALISSALVWALVRVIVAAGRRREKNEQIMKEKSDQLVRALASTSETEEGYERQALAARAFNKEMTDMRGALINVLEDVEESKREIERDYRRDSAIFEAVGEGLIATDKRGVIFLLNPAAAAIVGIPFDKAKGMTLRAALKLFSEENGAPHEETVASAFAGKSSRLPEKISLLNSEGKRTPVSGIVAPFFDERNRIQGVVAVIRDVTAERELDRQKSGFISIASHQLRTPLSTIRWFLDLLLGGDAGALKSQQREFLQDVYTSTTRMITLVGDLLDVSRIETGRIQMKKKAADLRALIRAAIGDHALEAAGKKLNVSLDCQKGLSEVMIDPELMRVAIGNLIGNAVNYSPAGGEVTVRAGKEGEGAVVEIRDSGIGIPLRQQHRVFERFFRADNAVANETMGSGLGLYISKLIIDASGGKIWFESSEGKGTRFFVALPSAAKGDTMGPVNS